MNRVMLTAKKNPKTTLSLVGLTVLALAGLCVFAAGWGGGTAYTLAEQSNLQGYTPNKAETEKFIVSLGKFKSLRTGAPDLFTEDLPKEVLLWKAIEEAYRRVYGREYLIERQTIGDCFVKNTMVLGEQIKPIENVRVGDRVWTAEGKLTTVISTRKIQSTKPVVTVHSLGGLPITCTADHQFLVYRMDRIGGKRVTSNYYERACDSESSVSCRVRVKACYESRTPTWVAAGDLIDTDYLLMPLSVDNPFCEPDSPGGLAATPEGAYLLGYFLGNGNAHGGSVEFSLSKQDVSDRLALTLVNAGFTPKIDDYYRDCEAWRIRIHSRELVEWMRSQFYDANGGKNFPAWAIHNAQFLEGLFAADGFSTDRQSTLDSTSRSIIYGAYTTLIGMGYEPTITEACRSAGTCANAKPLYRMIWREEKEKALLWRDERFACRPITKVVPVEGSHEVYDIGVQDDHHSFIADGAAVHNCVSHGTARAVGCVFAVDFINGARTKWLPVATEEVYAGRAEIGQGSMSDGWYGSAAAKWIKEHGVLFRDKYTGPNGEVEDYSVYSGQKAKQQGYRGIPTWLEKLAAAHKVPEVSLITSTGEAKAALANGYAMFVCSNVGFEPTTRNADGICRAGGSWSHCMSCLGYYTLANGETVFVIFNSWGPGGTSGPGGPHGIPTGAFACRERDFARILAARDSFACSGPNGFERRDIDHDTWATISPRGKDHLSRESEFNFAVAP